MELRVSIMKKRSGGNYSSNAVSAEVSRQVDEGEAGQSDLTSLARTMYDDLEKVVDERLESITGPANNAGNNGHASRRVVGSHVARNNGNGNSNGSSNGSNNNRRKPQIASQKQIDYIGRLLDRTRRFTGDEFYVWLQEQFSVQAIEDLDTQAASEVIDVLRAG